MSFFQNHSGWPLVPLKDIATLKRGYDLPVSQRTEGVVPIYAANGQNGTHNEVKINGPGVITGRSGTIGKVHYCEEGFWPLNTSLYVMNFHGNHPRWVFYMLKAFRLERYSEGAGVPTLNRNLVHDELIPLPPLPEQKRIAAILDKADAIRRKRQQAIQLADELLRSAFESINCKPLTLKKGGECTDGYRWVNLSDVARLESGHTPSRKVSEYWGGNIKWLSLKDIKNIKGVYIHDTHDKPTELGIDNSSARLLPKGTVALCRTASVGKCVILADSMATSQDFVNWVCGEEVLPEFLYATFLISSRFFDGLKQGSTHKTIYMPTVKDFYINLPPIDIQMRLARILKKIVEVKEVSRSQEEKMATLFRSLSCKEFKVEL